MNKMNKKIGLGLLLLLLLLLCIIGLFFILSFDNKPSSEDVMLPIQGLDRQPNGTLSTQAETTPIPYTPSNTSDQIASPAQEVDYLNSNDSVQLQIVAQCFFKAYLSGDIETLKLYLADAEATNDYTENIYSSNTYNNLQYFILKWFPKDIATKTTIEVQYQFLEKDSDSANYLGLVMQKISDQWKVIDFYIEK